MSDTENAHWMDEPNSRAAFWAQAADAVGLKGKDLDAAVHLALSDDGTPLDSVRDYEGTMTDALARLGMWAHEALAEAARANGRHSLNVAAQTCNYGDAIGRLSWTVIDGEGDFSILCTASVAGLDGMSIDAMHHEIVEHMNRIRQYHKFKLIPVMDNRVQRPTTTASATPRASRLRAAGGDAAAEAELERAKVRTAAVLEQVDDEFYAGGGVPSESIAHKAAARIFNARVAGPEPEQAAPPAPAASTAAPALDIPLEVSFPLETAEVALTSTGKRHYIVKGGRWRKFGCKCWPEVFESVFDAAGWDVGSSHTIEPGMMCHCEPNDKGAPARCLRIV